MLSEQESTQKIEKLALDFSIDIANASPLLIIMAKHQDGDTLYRIGKIYYARQTKEDYLKALQWFHLACHQLSGDAYCIVGQMHQYGKGVLVDHSKSIEFHQFTVTLDNAIAKYQLGCMCHYGIGRPVSYSKAFQWYSKAAHHNNRDAQCSLGYLYEKGQGVPQSKEHAMYWYKKAVLNGNISAIAKIGIFEKEKVTPKSPISSKALDFEQSELLKSVRELMVADDRDQSFAKKLHTLAMERKFKMI